jgi:hypothetical protein
MMNSVLDSLLSLDHHTEAESGERVLDVFVRNDDRCTNGWFSASVLELPTSHVVDSRGRGLYAAAGIGTGFHGEGFVILFGGAPAGSNPEA